MTIPYVASPGLLIAGIVVFAIGWLLRRWASRHDLAEIATGAAASAAWTAVVDRKRPAVPDELTSRVGDIAREASHVGKARKVAGYAARHAVAQVAGIVGLACLALGLLLAAVGVLWA